MLGGTDGSWLQPGQTRQGRDQPYINRGSPLHPRHHGECKKRGGVAERRVTRNGQQQEEQNNKKGYPPGVSVRTPVIYCVSKWSSSEASARNSLRNRITVFRDWRTSSDTMARTKNNTRLSWQLQLLQEMYIWPCILKTWTLNKN